MFDQSILLSFGGKYRQLTAIFVDISYPLKSDVKFQTTKLGSGPGSGGSCKLFVADGSDVCLSFAVFVTTAKTNKAIMDGNEVYLIKRAFFVQSGKVLVVSIQRDRIRHDKPGRLTLWGKCEVQRHFGSGSRRIAPGCSLLPRLLGNQL